MGAQQTSFIDGNRQKSSVVTLSLRAQCQQVMDALSADGPFEFEGATLSDGNHTITASVTDSGSKTGSASVSITVGTLNEAPTVSISSPADGSTFASGASISLAGTANDPADGDLTTDLAWTP